MSEYDLILDGSHMPEYDEIVEYINIPVRDLWRKINDFIQQRYKSLPRIMYSVCSGKPGWNVKYQKSGKSICTLYPEQNGFVALVVVTLDLMPVIEALSGELTEETLQTIRSAKPFNGTKWLMLQVKSDLQLEDVKQLIILKQGAIAK
ncbi:MAG TPA: DUF3788 domain-containing protein [Bacillota bacterium]|jgi:hypothetical protein|nr:DUF3788 domain-containing protein [Bacillota bacterium]HQJ37705.1 DUF3788 domain-containing protein [Bacillota bacterium]